MADGDQHFEEPCKLILQDDNATLQKEARGSSKQMVPTSPPNHIMSQPKITSHRYHREDHSTQSVAVHPALSNHPAVALPQHRRRWQCPDAEESKHLAEESLRNAQGARRDPPVCVPTHTWPATNLSRGEWRVVQTRRDVLWNILLQGSKRGGRCMHKWRM